MRKGGGKAKGASFERDICRQLSLWVSGGKHEDVFWRSAMSGGRSTVAHAKGKRLAAQAGDISCIHPAGNKFISLFFCECKFYADLNYTGLMTGTGNLVNFWCEASKVAKKYEKLPFMIAKQNRLRTTICLGAEGAGYLHIPTSMTILIAPTLNLHIYDAEQFFSTIEPPSKRSRLDPEGGIPGRA